MEASAGETTVADFRPLNTLTLLLVRFNLSSQMPVELNRRLLLKLAGLAHHWRAEWQRCELRRRRSTWLPSMRGTDGDRRKRPGGFDPTAYLRSWNFSHLPPSERAKFYRESPLPDGRLLREYEIFAVEREIEIAPGVFFPAWTYNGEVPGPTLRATEGDRVRVNFLNQTSHPHTIHFHGWHPPAMDGSLEDQQVVPGGRFVYEFDADPFGLHLYHCHTVPLKRHIHKGLYGVFLVDPKAGDTGQARPPADELVMVMNAFDTNFDIENEVYAVNTVANHYIHEPIRVTVGRPIRMYLVNLTEFDLVNSLHLHGMFFDVNGTGTSLE